MSLEALSWAAKQNVKSIQKLTLMMLANRHNGDTGQCNPSHSLLAQDCGLSDSGVRKAVRELEGLGLLKIVKSFKNGVQLPNQYILNTHLNITGGVGHEVTGGVSHGDRGWVTTEPTVGHEVTGGGSHGDTKTVIKPVNETVKETKRADAHRPAKPKNQKTFAEYQADCLAERKDLIPDGSEPEKVAEKLELSAEMVEVFWHEFQSVHLNPESKSSKKRKVDWLKTISDYLRKNYLQLWGFDRETGLPYWTQKGWSICKAMDSEVAA